MRAQENIDYARSLGIAMGSIQSRRVIGWTTNQQAADAMRDREGVTVSDGYNSIGPKGWEVMVFPDPPPDNVTELHPSE